jgi:hypothetical protein
VVHDQGVLTGWYVLESEDAGLIGHELPASARHRDLGTGEGRHGRAVEGEASDQAGPWRALFLGGEG